MEKKSSNHLQESKPSNSKEEMRKKQAKSWQILIDAIKKGKSSDNMHDSLLTRMFNSLEKSGIPMKHLEKNPVALIGDRYYKIIEVALSEKERYGRKNWIVFWGYSGTGKTFMSIAAAQMAIYLKKTVCFVTVKDFLNSMRPGSNVKGMMQQAIEAELLILDDFGKERMSEWVREKLFMIIDDRYGSGLPTIITTDVNLVEDYGKDKTSESILSRIRHYSAMIPLRVVIEK